MLYHAKQSSSTVLRFQTNTSAFAKLPHASQTVMVELAAVGSCNPTEGFHATGGHYNDGFAGHFTNTGQSVHSKPVYSNGHIVIYWCNKHGGVWKQYTTGHEGECDGWYLSQRGSRESMAPPMGNWSDRPDVNDNTKTHCASGHRDSSCYPTLICGPPPQPFYTKESPVIRIDRLPLASSTRTWLIHFYSQTSEKSKAIAQTWLELANQTWPDTVHIGAVNCDTTPDVCKQAKQLGALPIGLWVKGRSALGIGLWFKGRSALLGTTSALETLTHELMEALEPSKSESKSDL